MPMKKTFTLFALTGAVAVSAATQDLGNLSDTAGMASWMPEKVEEYVLYDGDMWVLNNTTKNVWSTDGKLTSATNKWIKQDYFYNEDGLLETHIILSSSGDTFVNTYKRAYLYDTVVKNLIVSNKLFEWIDGSWEESTDEYLVITRDAENRVTEVRDESYGWLNERTEITYGADSKATGISVYDDEDKLCIKIEEIVWEATDNQIVIPNASTFDWISLCTGANRISSATISLFDYEPASMTYRAEYPADGCYSLAVSDGDDEIYFQTYTLHDDNGSYTEVTREWGVTTTTKVDFDTYGLETAYEETEEEDGETSVINKECSITYNPTYGYPEQRIEFNYYNGDLENAYRYDYTTEQVQ